MEYNAQQRSQDELVKGSAKRIQDALNAWVSDDFHGAAASAPLALELFAKAVLWHLHPTLLVPLDNQQEATLDQLGDKP